MTCRNCQIPTLRQDFCSDECRNAWLEREANRIRVEGWLLWLFSIGAVTACLIYFLKRIGALP